MEAARAAVFAVCTLLYYLGGVPVRGEGSSADGDGLSSAELLYLQSERMPRWFSGSSRDALAAAQQALEDYSPALELEMSFDAGSLGENSSVVAVVSAECTNETCHAHYQSLHRIPVISVSPSCLGGRNSNTTTTSVDHHSMSVSSPLPLCMIPSLSHLPRGLAALISHYGWSRVAMLTETESQLVVDKDELYRALVNVSITDIRQSSISLSSPLSDALHRDYRIVILNTTPVLSRYVLCEAIRRDLNGHVWITPGWYPRGWWRGGGDAPVAQSAESNCSDRHLEQFIESGRRVLSFLQIPPSSRGNNSMSVDFQEFCQEAGLEDCMYGGLGYDAVWAISLALNETNSSGDLATALASSAFNGVSGRVEFDSQYHRVLGGYRLGQMRPSSENGSLETVPVATLTGGQLELSYLPGESEDTVWPGGVPPDGSPLAELKHPLTSLVVLCWVLSGAVIVWAIGCILFNLYFRKKKVIKLTSPTLNLMIAVGIILTNLATPLTMYPPELEKALPTFCIVRSWVLPIGWSLSLCTISVKMWRVFVIYRTTKRLQSLKQKKMKIFLQDGFMVTLVMCMVVVDVIVLIIGTSLPQTRFTPERVPDKEFPPYRNSEDIEVEYYNLQCVSDKGLIWVAFLFGYKILFLVSGVVLAILSRKVKVKGLNESREVQVTMIIAAPIVITGLVLRLLLSDYLNVVGTLYALSGSLYGALILGIIFLPKMVYLCKNPSGDQIYSSRLHSTSRKNSMGSKDRSTSLVSFDPTASLKSLMRKNSMESGLGSSVAGTEDEGKLSEKERRSASVTRHVLPTIEEGACSNTTDISDAAAAEGKLLLQGSSVGDGEVVLSADGNIPTCLQNFNFSEEGEGVEMPSPTSALLLSMEQKNALRRSSVSSTPSNSPPTTSAPWSTSDGPEWSATVPPGGDSGLHQDHSGPPVVATTDDTGPGPRTEPQGEREEKRADPQEHT